MKIFRMISLVLTLLLLAGCAGKEEAISISVPHEPSVQAEREPILEPELEAPGQPYWILGECAYDGGTAVVYEVQHPDSYNKRFSSDSIFYALRWQIFDAQGRKTGAGDSGWSNSFAIHGLPLSGLEAQEGLLTFSVQMPAEYSGEPLRRKFTLVLDDEKLSIPGENPNGYRYQVEDWYPIAREGDFLLENCTHYNRELERSEELFQLTGPKTNRIIPLDLSDPDFGNELYSLKRPHDLGPGNETPYSSEMSAALDPAAKTAVLTIPKLTVTLDFASGSQRTERHYRTDMLQTEIARSPDGRYAVYTSGEFDRFESVGGCDYLSVGPDGALHFLYSGSIMDQITFLGNDRILANTFSALTCYDAASGLPDEVQLSFDYGETVLGGEICSPKYLTIGLAADQKSDRVLTAYRLNTFGHFELNDGETTLTSLPVSLALFDFSGNKLADFDTGFSVSPFGKYLIHLLDLSMDEPGRVVIRDPYHEMKPAVLSYPIE